jgi:hypothetical protein
VRWKLSRTVLRGGIGGNTGPLLDLLGYAMVSVEILDLTDKIGQSHLQAVRTYGPAYAKVANEGHRRGKCALTRKQKTEARNKLIDEAIAGGIDENDEQAIFDYVRKLDATLLRKKQSGKELIDVKNMMKVYRRAKASE